MDRDSFVRYKSCSEALKLLPDENRLHAYDFITDYWIYGIEPDPSIDPVAYGYFLLVKPNIDANNRRFVNWHKGWRPKDNWDNSKKPKPNQNVTKTEPDVDVDDDVDEDVDVAEEKKKEEEIKKKLKTKKINKKVVYSDLFENFRKAYPKKKGKQKAREAWENAIKWGNDPEHLITKAWEYATEIKLKRVEDKYIKFAQWRLNEWRFDDDYFTGNNWIKPNLDDLY